MQINMHLLVATCSHMVLTANGQEIVRDENALRLKEKDVAVPAAAEEHSYI